MAYKMVNTKRLLNTKDYEISHTKKYKIMVDKQVKCFHAIKNV